MEEQEIFKGRIVKFSGSMMSGLATLVIDDIERGVVFLHCENAQTVRALDNCFGNVIMEGHTINQNSIKGKSIYYSEDFMGMFDGFSPEKHASKGVVQLYKKHRKERYNGQR